MLSTQLDNKFYFVKLELIDAHCAYSRLAAYIFFFTVMMCRLFIILYYS